MRCVFPVITISFVASLAACASSTHRALEPNEFAHDSIAASLQVAQTAPSTRDATIPEGLAGTIPAVELDAILDRGPGHFLAGIEVEPAFRNDQFAGWVLMRFLPADARIGLAPLQPGDIVVSVNQQPIARPTEFMSLWDKLRKANSLVIALERGGTPFELRYAIGR